MKKLFTLLFLVVIIVPNFFAQKLADKYNSGQNYYSTDFNQNLDFVNRLFNTNYTDYSGQNPGNLNFEFLKSPWPPDTGVKGSTHKGIDFRSSQPFDLYSPLDGYVTYTGGGSGTISIYNEQYGLTFFFIHCSSIFVIKNQKITTGQLVGKSGSTGTKPVSPHLHVELRSWIREHAQFSYEATNTNYDPRIIMDYFPYSKPINGNLDIYGGTSSQTAYSDVKIWCYPPNGNSSFSISNFKINGWSKSINVSNKSFSNGRASFAIDLNGIIKNADNVIDTLEFDVASNGTTTHFKSEKLYFLNIDNLNDVGLNSTDNYIYKNIQQGINNGLFKGSKKGSSWLFNPNSVLTKGQAAKVILTTLLRLNMVEGIDQVVRDGYPLPESNLTSEYFPYIQTLYNYKANIFPYDNSGNFSANDEITVSEFAYMVVKAFNLSSTNVKNQIVPTIEWIGESNSSRVNAAKTLSQTFAIVTDVNNNETGAVNLASFFNFTNNPICGESNKVNLNCPLLRSTMAIIISNVFQLKAQGTNITVYKSKASNIPKNVSAVTQTAATDLSQYLIIGNKFESENQPTGSAPSLNSSLKSTYSISDNETLTLTHPSEYDGANNGARLYFYWSASGGESFVPLKNNYQSVNFTPRKVTSTTVYKIYGLVGNTNGKIREYPITVIVKPESGTNGTTYVSALKSVSLSPYNLSTIKVEWNQIAEISKYIAEISTDRSFMTHVSSQTITTTESSVQWLVTGKTNGTYYARVKCVDTNGIESNWSNVPSLDFYGNLTPWFDEATFTPVSETSISTNSVTLKFMASGGNNPLRYTVYFSDYNPLGTSPIVENTTIVTKTLSKLKYNTTYYWKVKVVDSDGDEAWSEVQTLKVNPTTIPPTGSIKINNGATTTNSISVQLSLSSTDVSGDNVKWMRLSNDGINWSYWVAYSTTYSWNMNKFGGSDSYGLKTVYVQYRDISENISTTYSANITLTQGTPGLFNIRDKSTASLKEAIEYANAGDTIYATAGFFDLTSEISSKYNSISTASIGAGVKQGVNIIGAGSGRSTLYWSDGVYGLVLNGNNTIQGLTIINAKTTAIGIGAVSNCTIKNCVIKDSREGLYVTWNGTSSNLTISNNLFTNISNRAVQISSTDNLKFINNTVCNNGHQTYFITDSKNVVVANNIISNNGSSAVNISGITNLSFINNNVWNNTTGTTTENYCSGYDLTDQTGINNNISTDPKLDSNYKLLSGSPCIDKGTNVGLPYGGSYPDMGAYEFNANAVKLTVQSNVSSNFIVAKPDGTTISVKSGQSIQDLLSGIYNIIPQSLENYYTPLSKNISLVQGTYILNFTYTLDNIGPKARIIINGGDFYTQSKYVTIYNDAIDDINGLGNGSLMCFSNDGITWSMPEILSNKKYLWDLSLFGGNVTAGEKTIFAKFCDAKGYWSNTISSKIKYNPSGKISIAANNEYLQSRMLASSPGDVIFLKKGTYRPSNFVEGLKLQGSGQETVVTYPSSLNAYNETRFDNFNLKIGYLTLNYRHSFTNMTIDSTYMRYNSETARTDQSILLANSLFKVKNGVSYDVQLALTNIKTDCLNNVFVCESSTNGTSAQNCGLYIKTPQTAGIQSNVCNNIFYGYNKSGDKAGIRANYVINETNGTLNISNNSFYNTILDITYTDNIVENKQPLHIDPAFSNLDYKVAASSALLHQGFDNILYSNHNGSRNDIGLEGGVFYNTIPIAKAKAFLFGDNVILDASASIDLQTPNKYLLYRWDLNNDTIMDTDFRNTPYDTISTSDLSCDTIVCWVFDEHFAMNYVKIPFSKSNLYANNSINYNSSITSICSAGKVDISPVIKGTYKENNIFSVKLVNLINTNDTLTLHTYTSQSISQIQVSLPNVVSGQYKLFIESSNPRIISNSKTITINASSTPEISIWANNTIQCSDCNINLVATGKNMGTSPTFQWYINGEPVGTNSSILNTTLSDGDIVQVKGISNLPCISNSEVYSEMKYFTVVSQPETPIIVQFDSILVSSAMEGNQWYKDGVIISGATDQFYIAKESGKYSVEVNMSPCIKVQSVAYNYSANTGIINTSIPSIKLFPNPAKSEFTINGLEVDKSYQYVLYDLIGKPILKDFISNSKEKSVSININSGTYLLLMYDKNSKQLIGVNKLIVE